MTITVHKVDDTPMHTVPYQYAEIGGNTAVGAVDILRAFVTGLPNAIDALVCTSDLQGIALTHTEIGSPLLGQVLAEELSVLAEIGDIPDASKVGVLLSGDLYAASDLHTRGTEGDVRPVWQAFQQQFRWVAGVAGNHDRFGTTPQDYRAFIEANDHFYLDGTSIRIDQLRIAGVGGIIGNPTKPFRRSESEYQKQLAVLLRNSPDILVLHEGPAAPELGYLGSASIRTVLERNAPTLVVCGHSHWERPWIQLANGTDVINVDSRVVVLIEKGRI